MGNLNKSGKYGTGKNRRNAPSASDKAVAGDAWARKFDSFDNVGGSQGHPLNPDKASPGQRGASNVGNEY